jgi:hypothetical protein
MKVIWVFFNFFEYSVPFIKVNNPMVVDTLTANIKIRIYIWMQNSLFALQFRLIVVLGMHNQVNVYSREAGNR